MRFWLGVCLVVTGCGRVDFDRGGGDARSEDASDGDAPGGDAATPVCGDGICAGNAGELCVNCAADCATQAPVCGNGVCDPGESPGCYADCGPSPWPWTADETSAIAVVNAARTGGTTCPGGMPATAPALTFAPALTQGAREYAWEIAHQEFWVSSGDNCDGRTFNQRAAAGGFSDAFEAYGGAPMVAEAMAEWLGDPNVCPALMNPAFTMGAAGVAHDAQDAWVVVMK